MSYVQLSNKSITFIEKLLIQSLNPIRLSDIFPSVRCGICSNLLAQELLHTLGKDHIQYNPIVIDVETKMLEEIRFDQVIYTYTYNLHTQNIYETLEHFCSQSNVDYNILLDEDKKFYLQAVRAIDLPYIINIVLPLINRIIYIPCLDPFLIAISVNSVDATKYYINKTKSSLIQCFIDCKNSNVAQIIHKRIISIFLFLDEIVSRDTRRYIIINKLL